MPLPFDVTAEDVIVNRMKSRMKTLDNYRRTSMAAHNRLVPSVRLYAAAVGTEVRELADDHPNLPEVQRWRAKFDAYLEQYDLVDGGE